VKLSDRKLLALADALREAVAGNSERRRIAAARRVVAALAPVPSARAARKRGRRRVFDPEVATAHLIGIADSIDGLPECQADIVKLLGARLAAEWSKVPEITWLKSVVSKFVAGRRARDDLVSKRFNCSPDLQSAFGTAAEYLQFCNTRFRIEEKWLHDPELRANFGSAAVYLSSIIERATDQQMQGKMPHNAIRIS